MKINWWAIMWSLFAVYNCIAVYGGGGFFSATGCVLAGYMLGRERRVPPGAAEPGDVV